MRVGMIDTQGIRLRWELVGSTLDERGQRLFAAAEARAAGWGGKAAVARLPGLRSRPSGTGLMNSIRRRGQRAKSAGKGVAGDR